MHLLTLNAAGQQLAAPVPLDRRRRRLSQVLGRHVDRARPHMVAVQRARDPLQPIEEAWVVRGRDKAGAVRSWPRRYLPADAIVVVVYLPRGGGGAAGGARSKSPVSIALSIAAVALVAFSGPLGAAAAGALKLGATAAKVISAGLVLGGTAVLSLASQAKANKQATDTTQVYGVAGGGNLPRQGDRIPRGYGRSWMKPDLSQPDFSQYDGDDQILFKRHTVGVGRYRAYRVRAGKQVIWTEGEGFVAPFDDPRNRIEFIHGTASQLVPNSVVSASGIGGLLPRPADNPGLSGPFLINQRGALVTRLQVDFQFPQGISATVTKGSGAVLSNQPGAWSVLFEYAPIDATGAVTGPWQVLYDGTSAKDGNRFATHPLRYTRFADVPAGRYAVRGRNRMADTSTSAGRGVANVDSVQWDAASGWVADAAIRPGITEMCLRIYATKASQAAAFGEIEVDAGAIIPVWTGSGWVEQETSKAVWAFLDIMRNQDYGGAVPDSQLDVGTALGYALSLGEFDTFDATIRGPISVYEAAATVLLPMRAEPVHLGRYWSLVRDEPKAVRRHVISRRQMLKGSTQLVFDLDAGAGAGHVVGEFDQDGDYRSPNQTTAIYGEASLTPTRQRWTGVKSHPHAQHLTRWRAACGAFRRQTVPFAVEMEGRIYRRGDSLAVDPWFLDTRKVAGVVESIGDLLVLDADVAIEADDVALLRDRTGRQWGPVAIAGQGAGSRQIRLDAASRATIEAVSGKRLGAVLSDGRGEMTTVLVGSLTTLSENYLIQSVKPTGPSKAQVEALIDDPRVWAAIGASPAVPPTGSSGLSDPESPSILGLTANAVPIAAGFRCDYAIQPGRGARTFEVGVSYDDGARFDVRSDAPVTGSIELNPVDPTNVVVRARAFGATGLPGRYFQTVLALPGSSVNVQLPPIDYEGLGTDVRSKLDHILDVEKEAQESAAAALARGNAAFDRALAAAAVGDENTAAIVYESQQRHSGDTAIAGDLSAAVVRIGGVEAGAATERTARIDGDTAQALRTDAVIVRTADVEAAVLSEQTARKDAYGVLANQISIVSATVNDNANTASANLFEEKTARASVDDALAREIGVVSATVNNNDDTVRGLIVEEGTVRASSDGALSTRIESVIATANGNTAAITSTNQALANVNSAMVARTDDLYARSDAGTAFGRLEFRAESGPAGVSARIAAYVATQRGGQTRGAGYYIEVRDDGTGRFVVDADRFFITKNGSSVPAFSFDGQTLTIPMLVVTQQAILPGATSDRYAPTGPEHFDVPGVSNDWREIPGTAVVVNPDTLWSVVFSGTTVFAVTANGTNNSLATNVMQIALGVDGVPYTGNAFASYSVTAGNGNNTVAYASEIVRSSAVMELYEPGASRRFSLLYRLTGHAAGSGKITYSQLKVLVSKR